MSDVSNSQFLLVLYFITHDSASVHVSSIHLLPFAPHASTPPLSGISRHHPLGDRWSTHAPMPPPAHHRLFWKRSPVGSMVRELKAGCISCDYSITHVSVWCLLLLSQTICATTVRGFGTSPEPDALNPEITVAKRFPWKRREATNPQNPFKKIKKIMDQPQKDQQTQKRSHPTHLTLMGLIGLCWFPCVSENRFSAPMSLLWQVHMLFWLWCSFNGHGMQVLEIWKWGTSTIFSFNEFRKPPCVKGRTAKGSGFKGNTANMFLAEISHVYICFDCHECSWSS